MTKETKYQQDLDDSMQNAVRVYEWYKEHKKLPPKESDDYGIYKYGEWITKNLL